MNADFTYHGLHTCLPRIWTSAMHTSTLRRLVAVSWPSIRSVAMSSAYTKPYMQGGLGDLSPPPPNFGYHYSEYYVKPPPPPPKSLVMCCNSHLELIIDFFLQYSDLWKSEKRRLLSLNPPTKKVVYTLALPSPVSLSTPIREGEES